MTGQSDRAGSSGKNEEKKAPNAAAAKRRRRYRRAAAGATKGQMLQGLEPRQLLAADLTGLFTSTPVVVRSGTTQNITVAVFDSGDAKAAGSLVTNFYLAPDGQAFDPQAISPLGIVTRSVSILPGNSVNISFTLPFNAALVAGDYRIYAVINPNGKIAESDSSNNTLQSDAVSVVQPDYDLTGSFGAKTSLVQNIVVGKVTNGTVQMVISNPASDTAALPVKQNVMADVVARPDGALDDSQDVVLNRAAVKASVGGLAPGQTRTMTVPVQFPATLALGNYQVIIQVDTTHALSETNEDNNETAFATDVTVAEPFTDPALAFNAKVTLPANVVADGRKLPLAFNLSNLGNVTIPSGQTCSIDVMAHNVADGSDHTNDVDLQTFTKINLGGLGVGKIRTVTLSPALLNLSLGEYQIDAAMTSGIASDVMANNDASTEDLSLAPMNVAQPFYDLKTTLVTTSFPPAVVRGQSAAGTVTVGVQNLSNSILPPAERANITVWMRPANATSSASDMVIGTAASVSVASLGQGATRSFAVPATIPAGASAGDYILVAAVTTSPTLSEADTSNNVTTGSAITVAAPFTDVAIVSAKNSFPTPTPSGSGANGTVVLKNMGNQNVQANITIDFFATPSDIGHAFGIGAQQFLVTLMPGQSTVPLSLALTMTPPITGLPSGVYQLIALIDTQTFSDANGADNQLDAGTVTVAQNNVDLKISAASQPFASLVNGSSSGSGHVTITNVGSGTSIGAVTITFYATVSGTIDDNAIAIGSKQVNVDLTSAGSTASIAVALTLPDPASLTTYKILAQISAISNVDNNAADNTSLLLGTVAVIPV